MMSLTYSQSFLIVHYYEYLPDFNCEIAENVLCVHMKATNIGYFTYHNLFLCYCFIMTI